jgi:outer membrane protein assembly factor BamB
VWALDLRDKYGVARRKNVGGGRRDFGFTTSPLVLGEIVVVEVGSLEGTVMAFDARTGERRWASELRGSAGHTSGPVPMMVGSTPCLATLTLEKLVVMRIDRGHEGETVADYPWRTDFACNLATPAVHGDRLVLTSGYNRKRTECLELRGGGIRKIWSSRAHALVSSPVIHKERVYVVHGALRCLDASTGQVRWRTGSFGHGSALITEDGKLLVFGEGQLALFETCGSGAGRELARVDKVVGGTCYPHVALAGGFVFCRDRQGALVCFSVRK